MTDVDKAFKAVDEFFALDQDAQRKWLLKLVLQLQDANSQIEMVNELVTALDFKKMATGTDSALAKNV